MENIQNIVKGNDAALKEDFYLACKEKKFKDLVSIIPVGDDVLRKHTSLLMDAAKEYYNCINCPGRKTCPNSLSGYCYMPTVADNDLSFEYLPCKYTKKELKDTKYNKNMELFDASLSLKEAKMKNIYIDDNQRKDILKKLDSYYNNYFKKKDKALYLCGNFGSGKTYMIAALFNELAKKNVKSAIVYFPEFLRSLKSSFNYNIEDVGFETKFDYIKRIPLLLLDDIGAENVTAWGRDEILSTILQYRMDNNLATFFTSNLDLEELEEHLSSTKDKVEKVKARRIIERIKYLSTETKLIGINRRS